MRVLTVYFNRSMIQVKLYEDGEFADQMIEFEGLDYSGLPEAEFPQADCVVCPGGVLKPVRRGIYRLDDRALSDIGKFGDHKYNSLMKAAADIAAKIDAPAYMLNPMSCDELLTINRISSNSNVRKLSRYFALEHAAAIDTVAKSCEELAENSNYIVAYVDDIVSVGAHMRGFCIDVNDAVGQEGPMGFTSSGDIPVAQLASFQEKSGQDVSVLKKQLTEESGLLGYIGVTEAEQVDALEDAEAKLVVDALIYQVAKWIGSSAMVLQGKVDKIIIAGKAAASSVIVSGITERTAGIAPIVTLPELDAEKYMASVAGVADTFAWPLQTY